MLSNAYFLAKFRFDTAENEPAKNLQNFANFPNIANPKPPAVIGRNEQRSGDASGWFSCCIGRDRVEEEEPASPSHFKRPGTYGGTNF